MSDRTCTVEGCNRPHSCKGLCAMHYKRLAGTGTTDKRPVASRACDVAECLRGAVARGVCAMHYQRWKKTGTTERNPNSSRPEPNLAPRYCEVEECDSLSIYRFCVRHAELMTRTGDTKITKVVTVQPCAAPDCLGTAITKGLCPSHYVTLRTTGRLATVAVCLACGAEYRKLRQAKSCGKPECRRWVYRASAREGEARRRNRKRAAGEVFDPHEVYERDNWICGICTEPIDRQLRWPDKYSASLDHIIPLVLDGLHTRANTQPAHLICNFRKGARTKPPT